ncbi:VOC family protein [Streptomyces sp. NPDC008121]|uniref:VOC family protein n=1 Tax=Streptomyces sp. NPDC008121 TaxID=3364809 RepID=UPI0036E7C636
MLIKKLGHVLLRTADLDRSRDFYSSILGMRIMEDDPDHPEVCTFMTLGEDFHNLDLARHPDPENAQKPREDHIGLVHIAFLMESWDAMRQMYQLLQDRNVKILSASDHVNQRSMYVKDPDGNVLEFYYEIPDAVHIFAQGRDDHDENLPVTQPGEPLPGWLVKDWPPVPPAQT